MSKEPRMVVLQSADGYGLLNQQKIVTMSKEPRMVVLQSADGYGLLNQQKIVTMSKEPRMVVLQSADGYSFPVEEYVVKNNRSDENTVYPLPGVSREILSVIIDFCKISHVLSNVASNSHHEICRHSFNAAIAVSRNHGKLEARDKEAVARIEASDKESVPDMDEKTAVSEREVSDKETVAENEGKKDASEVEASDKETVSGSKENKDVSEGEASDKETVIEGKSTKPGAGGIEALLEIKLDKERKAVFVVKLKEEDSLENETSSGKKILLKLKPSDEQEVVLEPESSCKIKFLTEETKQT